MEKMKKNLVKFAAGIVGIAALGGAVFYGVSWYQYRNSPEYAQKLEYQKLLEAYKNDTYGGDTPEETLQLFIDALKVGDTELAAKYFMIGDQEKIKEELEEVKLSGRLNDAILELGKGKFTKKDEDRAFFTLVDENNFAISQMVFGFNIDIQKWKILEL